jgi:glycosyltransferase involved in cell wall biosynthesis
VRVERIGVVIPARDEAPRLERCLRALADAVAAVEQPVEVVLVLDACTDDSATVVADLSGRLRLNLAVIETSYAAAGAARAAGAEHLLASLGVGGTWIATTDADSSVPLHWLRGQLLRAALGADVVAGTVRVRNWEGRPAEVRRQAEALYAQPLSPAGHGHVHGANLAISAPCYRRLGGFPRSTHDEDVELVAAAQSAGANVDWAAEIAVTTSARSDARAPHGFAAHLDRLATG